ncbi:MAG: hypothetical protein U0793_14540 [Gemmataceae bacterium]
MLITTSRTLKPVCTRLCRRCVSILLGGAFFLAVHQLAAASELHDAATRFPFADNGVGVLLAAEDETTRRCRCRKMAPMVERMKMPRSHFRRRHGLLASKKDFRINSNAGAGAQQVVRSISPRAGSRRDKVLQIPGGHTRIDESRSRANPRGAAAPRPATVSRAWSPASSSRGVLGQQRLETLTRDRAAVYMDVADYMMQVVDESSADYFLKTLAPRLKSRLDTNKNRVDMWEKYASEDQKGAFKRLNDAIVQKSARRDRVPPGPVQSDSLYFAAGETIAAGIAASKSRPGSHSYSTNWWPPENPVRSSASARRPPRISGCLATSEPPGARTALENDPQPTRPP